MKQTNRSKTTRARFLICCIAILSSVASAQTIDIAKLDKYFETLEHEKKFMGSVAISKDGQLLYSKQLGFSDIEAGTKPNNATKYRIGSISKTFTTVLIFKAIEEKKLKLTDLLSQYYPGVPNAAKITIEMLLRHRSGIHNYTDADDFLQWNTLPKSEKELTDLIIKGGSDFEPNSKAEYSNSNFVLLSFILQKVYNRTYSNLLNERIVTPLKLINTHYGGKINPANNESYSYTFSGNWEKESETDMSLPIGAGGIISTAADLNTFADALFHGKLISAESLKQMETIKDGFGMGLFQVPFYDHTGFGHNGGIDGFRSTLSYFPNDKVCVAILSNAMNYESNAIAIAMLSAVYNKPYDIPDFRVYPVSSNELDMYSGEYSSTEIPLKITVTKSGKTLIAQATGQSAFELQATAKDQFAFEPAGIKMEFHPDTNTMILKQGGKVFHFSK